MKTDEERVVITGIGIVSPIGCTVDAFWHSVENGVNGVRPFSGFEMVEYPVQMAAQTDISNYPLDDHLSKKLLKRHDPSIQYCYLAGHQAFVDSGLSMEDYPERMCSVVGTGAGGTYSFSNGVQAMAHKGFESVHPFTLVNLITSSAGGLFAQTHNLCGPNFTPTAACATSNYSMAIAASLIRSNAVDVAFAGGTEAAVHPFGVTVFGNLFTLSTRKEKPETASRPFDKDRDGFVLSDGAAVLCMERLSHAKKRNANIYCELSGYGWSCDAYNLVAPRPEGSQAGRAISMTLNSAELNVSDIDLVNCHATSTTVGDVAEYNAMYTALGDYSHRVPVHSTKSMVGHSLGAAGAMEAIAVIHAIKNGVAHPTINQFEQDKEIKFNVIKNEARRMDVTHVLSNGFAFGGLNASIMLSKFMG